MARCYVWWITFIITPNTGSPDAAACQQSVANDHVARPGLSPIAAASSEAVLKATNFANDCVIRPVASALRNWTKKKRSRVQNKTIITRQNRKEVKWKLRSGSGIFDGCLFWRIDVELWNVTISWCENDFLQVTIIVITKFQVLQRTAKFTDQRVNTKQVRRAQLPPGSENKSPMGLTLGLTAPWWAYPVMHVPNYV